MAEMGKSSLGSGWYFSRKEIEESSPSRRDGIDLKRETCLRKSYCTFLQDLGMRLKVPQITIATAIVFCHRFFIRQSHAKNDRRTIATVCMFLAAKVEESPQPLQNVILVSYGMIHKNDPSAAQRIKQKEVYEQQKDLILLGERLVLATLGFELNVQHPYIPLVMSIKKFNIAHREFVQAAWNFVNDGLRTLLCLQYKPQHIAAGAILLSARFYNLKLPSDAERPWWHEFDVTARQLEDISNQMMALYHRKRMAGSGVEGSNAGGSNHPKMVASNVGGNAITLHTRSQGVGNVKEGGQLPDNGIGSSSRTNENKGTAAVSGVHDHRVDGRGKDCLLSEAEPFSCSGEKVTEASSCSIGDAVLNEKGQTKEVKEGKNEGPLCTSSSVGNPNLNCSRAAKAYSQANINKDKVRAALEKRKRSQIDVVQKTDLMNEDDLIERELEIGIELPLENKKIRKEGRQETGNPGVEPWQVAIGGVDHGVKRDLENVEEGELSSLESEYSSPRWLDCMGRGHRGISMRDMGQLWVLQFEGQ